MICETCEADRHEFCNQVDCDCGCNGDPNTWGFDPLASQQEVEEEMEE